jgi:hypothetical protein
VSSSPGIRDARSFDPKLTLAAVSSVHGRFWVSRAGLDIDVSGVHRPVTHRAVQLDVADLAAGAVPVEHRRAGLAGHPPVAPPHHDQ